MPMQPPKNLIILCADEMRGDCLGANRLNPDIQTPQMDALAGRGVNLSRHFTTFPKCVPARTSMMTGRYCHTDGFRSIFEHLPADRPNLLKSVLDHGYESAVFGLNHAWANMLEASHTPSQLAPGQHGLRIDHHSWTEPFRDIYEKYRANAPDKKAFRDRIELDRPLTRGLHYQGNVDVHWDSEAVTKQALRLLSEVRDSSRPLFMQVNISPPHPPYAVPEPWYSMYDSGQIEAYPHDLPHHAPLALRAQRKHRTGLNPDPALLRKMQAVYYGMISRVDEQFGRIINAIEQYLPWEDTLILLTSDHGDFAGQYGLPEKWDTTFADCLTHVPCVLVGGRLPEGQTIKALSDHTDLASTLMRLMDLQPPDWLTHGHDLTPLLMGEVASIRQAVFADGGHEIKMRRRFSNASSTKGKQQTYLHCPDAMARAKMIRTDQYKLIMRETGDHELYDLHEDRWELDNRYEDPAVSHIRQDLMAQLIDWMLKTDPDQPWQEQVHA